MIVEPDDDACSESSYSSNNSLASGLSYIEETVEEDGKSEIVLVAKPSAAGTVSVSTSFITSI